MVIGYFDRSWGDLSLDPAWWKVMIILCLVNLIPIIGQIVVMGYLFQWGRDSAWGVTRSLPSHMGKLKPVLRSGSIAFVITVCWSLIFSAVWSLFSSIPYVGVVFDVIFFVAGLFLQLFFQMMALRGVIYDSFEPGLQIKQAWEMLKDEPNGFFRILGMSLLPCLLTIPLDLVIFALLAAGYAGFDGGATAQLLSTWTTVSSGYIPFLIVLGCIVFAMTYYVTMMVNSFVLRSLGYWMAQFEPARWGNSADGVPAGVGPRQQRKE